MSSLVHHLSFYSRALNMSALSYSSHSDEKISITVFGGFFFPTSNFSLVLLESFLCVAAVFTLMFFFCQPVSVFILRGVSLGFSRISACHERDIPAEIVPHYLFDYLSNILSLSIFSAPAPPLLVY